MRRGGDRADFDEMSRMCKPCPDLADRVSAYDNAGGFAAPSPTKVEGVDQPPPEALHFHAPARTGPTTRSWSRSLARPHCCEVVLPPIWCRPEPANESWIVADFFLEPTP